MKLPVFMSAGLAGACSAVAFSPVLPTDNDNLFLGHPERFYMHVDRDFEGKKTTPWEGGTYGFTRGPERIGGKVVLTKFHEGIDISPVRRNTAGEPLDDVRAIEAGTVVHASNDARDSNYGKYVVIGHDVNGAPVYSLYAHLASVDVQPGQRLKQGERLGRLGHTGHGLDCRRAHLHLELAILWNDRYEDWHNTHFTLPNKHGLYNGMNLMGLDVAEFYLQQKHDPQLTLPGFIARQEVAFRVRIPASPGFQLPHRYPWLVRGDARHAHSWLVSFTNAGFPVAIEASDDPAESLRVEWARPSKIPCGKATRSLLEGPQGQPRLAANGQKLLQLITGTLPPPPSTPDP